MTTQLEIKYVKNVYEDIAPHFNDTRIWTWKWISNFIYSLPKNSYICDIGCGNGRNMLFKEYNFIGIDNCNSFLQFCKNKNLNVINADITNIPIKSSYFDAIICIASFHHLSNIENRIKCLYELKRLLKPNGKILLSVWSKIQPPKTRRIFKNYGDNIVEWNNFGKIFERYYYIFKVDELYNLFKKVDLKVESYCYDMGNEIFILY